MVTQRAWWVWFGAAAIIVATVIAYTPAMRGGFIWDDDQYVEQNMTLRSLDGLSAIWLSPRATPQYYPLVHTTFWIEYHLWGLSPLGYKLVNVLLHVISALLLWRLLALLRIPGGHAAGWLAAAVFALHPVHVESVAWITERKNVLSLALYLAAMGAMLRAMCVIDRDDAEVATQVPVRWGWYACGCALFVAALLSKTVTCSLPAAVLLIIYYKRGRIRWRDMAMTGPLFAVGLFFALLTAYLERTHVGASGGDWSLSVAQRVLIAGRTVWFYASKLVWPSGLSFIYPRWVIDVSQPRAWLYPLAAAAVVAWLWRARKRLGRGPIVAALLFGGTLLPALGFIDIYPMRYSFVADHFQYHAGGALIALAAALAMRGVQHYSPLGRRIGIAIAVLVLAALGVRTWQQGHVYESRITLWEDTLAKDPRSWMAMGNLGVEMQRIGEVERAESLFREAIAVNADASEALGMLGALLVDTGRAGEAIAYLQRAVDLSPESARLHNHLGLAWLALGRLDHAIACFDRAVELDEKSVNAQYNRAFALQRAGRPAEAIAGYEQTVALQPGHLDAHVGLVELLPGAGRLDDAIAHLRAAIAIAKRAGRNDLVTMFDSRLRQLRSR